MARDFQQQALALGVKRWPIHDCSICGYHCGFIFRGDAVYYDGGCYCSMQEWRPRSWQDLADHYNLQKAETVIAQMNAFWGFDS